MRRGGGWRLAWRGAQGARAVRADVPFLDIEGLMVAMGNANFRRGVFRVCKVYPQADVDGVCP